MSCPKHGPRLKQVFQRKRPACRWCLPSSADSLLSCFLGRLCSKMLPWIPRWISRWVSKFTTLCPRNMLRPHKNLRALHWLICNQFDIERTGCWSTSAGRRMPEGWLPTQCAIQVFNVVWFYYIQSSFTILSGNRIPWWTLTTCRTAESSGNMFLLVLV